MAGTQNPVREPRQARSRATREAILEAAARIIEADGEAPEAFNTNRVAAVAGVSVGTLYQYFSDKQAILVALARREILAVREGADAAGVEDPRRRAIRALIGAFPGRPRVRRASLMALMAVESAQGLADETRRTARLLPARPDLSPLDAFVLTRAVVGVIRAAVLEGSDHLRDPGLEDALMRLIEGYGAQPNLPS
jgi:AcrR family transcriptional regulator